MDKYILYACVYLHIFIRVYININIWSMYLLCIILLPHIRIKHSPHSGPFKERLPDSQVINTYSYIYTCLYLGIDMCIMKILLFIYIYLYEYIHIYRYIYIYIYIYMNINVRTYMCIHERYVCIYLCVCTQVLTWLYTYMQMYLIKYTYIYIYIYIYVYIHR
jgi:hypothetical protein